MMGSHNLVSWADHDSFTRRYRCLRRYGKPIDSWAETPSGPFTECLATAGHYWIVQPELGGIRFRERSCKIDTYPAEGVDVTWFRRCVMHYWLPLVYYFWGYQVLHSSAVAHHNSRMIVAFAGMTGAGKSTLAYGLGQRKGWRQIADDSLAFTVDNENVRLCYIPNTIRLRPASAHYFTQQAYSHEPLSWSEMPPSLRRIYFVEGSDSGSKVVEISAVSGSQAYLLLLKQAFMLHLNLPAHNRRLMRNYLALNREVGVFRLVYRRTFDMMETILDTIEQHVLQTN